MPDTLTMWPTVARSAASTALPCSSAWRRSPGRDEEHAVDALHRSVERGDVTQVTGCRHHALAGEGLGGCLRGIADQRSYRRSGRDEQAGDLTADFSGGPNDENHARPASFCNSGLQGFRERTFCALGGEAVPRTNDLYRSATRSRPRMSGIANTMRSGRTIAKSPPCRSK